MLNSETRNSVSKPYTPPPKPAAASELDFDLPEGVERFDVEPSLAELQAELSALRAELES